MWEDLIRSLYLALVYPRQMDEALAPVKLDIALLLLGRLFNNDNSAIRLEIQQIFRALLPRLDVVTDWLIRLGCYVSRASSKTQTLL